MYNNIKLKYLDYEYNITDKLGSIGLGYQATGNTASGSTGNNTISVTSAGTFIEVDNDFSTSSQTNDSVLLSIFDTSGITISPIGLEHTCFLNYYTTIEEINGNIIKIGDIPEYIYNDLQYSDYKYRIKNLHYSDVNMLKDYVNVSTFKNVIYAKCDGNLVFEILNKETNLINFDYQFLTIEHSEISGTTISTTAHTFDTDNQYTYYELDTFLNNIFDPNPTPINLYNENSLCLGNYYIQEIYDTTYDTSYVGSGWYPIQSSRYKIIPYSGYKNTLKYFKPYTYIDFGILEKTTDSTTYSYHSGGTLVQSSVTFDINVTPYQISDSGRTMITEVNEEYMIIEKPYVDNSISGFTGGTFINSGVSGIYDIINVAKTTDISDILLKTYINRDDDYYHTKSSSEKYRISGAYGQIINNNSIIRHYVTGLIYQDENDLFNLNLFNINIDSNFNFEDANLLYTPIELIDIGVDKKIKGFW